MGMKRKTMVGWIAAVVSAAVLITTMSVGIYFIDKEHRSSRLTVENIYQENLYFLSESLSNIEVNMSKLVVSNNNLETAVLLNDIYHHSTAASRAIGVLPLDPVEAHVTDRFLNQLGDWCISSVRRFVSAEGEAVVASASASAARINNDSHVADKAEEMSDDVKDNAEELGEDIKNGAENVGENIKDMLDQNINDADTKLAEKAAITDDAAQDKDTGGLTTFDEQCEEFYARTQRLNTAVKDAAEGLNGGSRLLTRRSSYFTNLHLDELNLMQGINTGSTTRTNEVDLPQIIYDGPFSDGQNQKSFKCLEGKQELSEQAAAEQAQKIFQPIGLRNLRKVGESKSPRAFVFCGMTNKTEMYVCISTQGGMIISASLPCDNSGKTDTLDENAAKQKAAEYAAMCGYDGLTPVWYTSAAGYAVVNFTPEKEGVIYYPDLVKIKVCLVTGDFAGVEALGFCACNYERLSPSTTKIITKEEAQKSVSGKLLVTNARLAVIPKNSKEHLCYEFAAEYKGLDYFVYIDAVSGAQVNIMRVLNGEQGKIVM